MKIASTLYPGIYSNSQLGQDLFAFSTAKNKSYIEVGAWKPIHYNNSYLLEKNGWNGFSIEYDLCRHEEWKERKNKIFWENALTLDYARACQDLNLPNRIGYLSCDIEPPENTFSALKRTIEQGLSFDCITFEHDKYHSQIDYDPIVTDYLKNKGYKVAVNNVYRTRKNRIPGKKKKDIRICYMETWFVNNDIEFELQDYKDWILENLIAD